MGSVGQGGSHSETQLRRARDLMDRRFSDPGLNLETIAAASHLSKFHFVRAFRRQFHTTPGAYLTTRRVERAQDLLRFANLTVTEVCNAVGYSSLGSFSQAFAVAAGESPSAFQARWRSAGGPRIPGCEILMRSAPVGVARDK